MHVNPLFSFRTEVLKLKDQLLRNQRGLVQGSPKPKPTATIKQEVKIKPFDAGEVVEISSDSLEEELGDMRVKWGQGPTTSATGSAAVQKKNPAKSTAILVRENEEIKNDLLKYLFLTIKKKCLNKMRIRII